MYYFNPFFSDYFDYIGCSQLFGYISGESKFDVQLERSNKNFAKKPITQVKKLISFWIKTDKKKGVSSLVNWISLYEGQINNETGGCDKMTAYDFYTCKTSY